MIGRMLKNIKDGTLYGYHPILARHPLIVEATDEDMKVKPKTPARRGRSRKQEAGLSVETEESEIHDAEMNDLVDALEQEVSADTTK